MEYKNLGKTNEKIPVFGLGTWKLNDVVGKETAIEALKFGFENGVRFVDTAEVYGTEPEVGKAIKGYDGMFVATKVAPPHFHYDDVIKSCDASLKKLGIKTIDLYQLHWPNNSIPIEETMRAMEKLVKDGKIRYIGVSNFSVEEMKAAQEALKVNELVTNQFEYSILVRGIEKDILGYCEKEKITVMAYSPLTHGALYKKEYSKLTDFLAGIGKAYSKTATQVALNWLICKEPVMVIPKASRKEHVMELIGSADWKLKPKDIGSINEFLSSTGISAPKVC
jgi:diketogulonate reductase-like aldo/keto reductase